MIKQDILFYYSTKRFSYEPICLEFIMTEINKIPILFEKLKEINITNRKNFLELGSGLGVITTCAALEHYNAIGIEKEKKLINFSRKALEELCLDHLNCKFIHGDYYQHKDLIKKADFIYAFPWYHEYPNIISLFKNYSKEDSRLILFGTYYLMTNREDYLANLKKELYFHGFTIFKK